LAFAGIIVRFAVNNLGGEASHGIPFPDS
jgi:hypothetical protein